MANASASARNPIQIGEAAQRAQLSIDTIRFYERTALVPRAPRTMGQFRLYTADDVARLTFIRQMQGLGFSLQEIKQLLDLRDRGVVSQTPDGGKLLIDRVGCQPTRC